MKNLNESSYHGMEDNRYIYKALKYCNKFLSKENKYRSILNEDISNYSASTTELDNNFYNIGSLEIDIVTNIAESKMQLENIIETLKSINFKINSKQWKLPILQAAFIYYGIKYYNLKELPEKQKELGEEINNIFNIKPSTINRQMALLINNYITHYKDRYDDYERPFLDWYINPALLLAWRYRDNNFELYQKDIEQNKLHSDLKYIANKIMGDF